MITAIRQGRYNNVSGSEVADGTIAAVVSTVIMVQAVALVVLELRAMWHGERSVLGPR